MSTQKPKFVEEFLSALFTERDQFAIDYLSKVFMHFEMDFSPVPVISKSEAQGITTPLNIFAAKQDIIFPGEKMLRRSQKVFPSIKNAILLPDSKHVQNKADNNLIEGYILNP